LPKLRGIDSTVLGITLAITLMFLAFGILAPENFDKVGSQALKYLTTNFGWLFLLTVFSFVIFVILLAFSSFGQIKLGRDDEKPEYSTFSWFAMLFSAGMGIGLIFWSVAEPITHFMSPPVAVNGNGEAASVAMRYVFFHWGLHPWAIYSVVGLSLAYFSFRHNTPALISSTLRPVLGNKVNGFFGKTVDILAVLATLFGVATSLGLGTLQLNSGLNYLFGIKQSIEVNILIIVVITILFTLSTLTGIKKGIKFLSNTNVVLAILLMVFIASVGPTRFILDLFTNTLGDYFQNVIGMSLWTDPVEQKGWVRGWTIFYWAWWIAWAPFVGGFIARISRGRTIKEFILGVLLAPTLFSFIWMSVFGGAALNFEITNPGGISTAVSKDMASALFVTLGHYPLTTLLSGLALILITVFFITSADSATFVISMLVSKGDLEPGNKIKIMWGVIQGGIAIILLVSGGLIALQTASIVAAFPFMLVMILMAYSLVKALRQEKIKGNLQKTYNNN